MVAGAGAVPALPDAWTAVGGRVAGLDGLVVVPLVAGVLGIGVVSAGADVATGAGVAAVVGAAAVVVPVGAVEAGVESAGNGAVAGAPPVVSVSAGVVETGA